MRKERGVQYGRNNYCIIEKNLKGANDYDEQRRENNEESAVKIWALITNNLEEK